MIIKIIKKLTESCYARWNKWYVITKCFTLTSIFHFLHNSIYKYVLSLSFYVCYETMENKFPNKEELKEDTEVDEAWTVII